MIQKLEHINTSGVYMIKNTINNKVYIGQSHNIYMRIKDHITRLNTKNKNTNPLLIKDWHVYGRNSFIYEIIEEISDRKMMIERERYWIEYYQSFNLSYNLRTDGINGMTCHQSTIEKMRNSSKRRFEKQEERNKCSHDYWQTNPDKLKYMIDKLSHSNVKYFIDQYDKQMNFIKRWESIIDLMKIHPEYKKHNIYAVCSGEKPSMYKFIWKKVLKGNEDIV